MIKEKYFWTASFWISYDIMNCVEFSKYQKMIPGFVSLIDLNTGLRFDERWII